MAVSVGIDKSSFNSQMYQSADSENDNIPKENDIITLDVDVDEITDLDEYKKATEGFKSLLATRYRPDTKECWANLFKRVFKDVNNYGSKFINKYYGNYTKFIKLEYTKNEDQMISDYFNNKTELLIMPIGFFAFDLNHPDISRNDFVDEKGNACPFLRKFEHSYLNCDGNYIESLGPGSRALYKNLYEMRIQDSLNKFFIGKPIVFSSKVNPQILYVYILIGLELDITVVDDSANNVIDFKSIANKFGGDYEKNIKFDINKYKNAVESFEYSSEELHDAQFNLENRIENTEDPIFNTESAFDLVKIITATIMGEPRLDYKPIKFKDKFFAIDFVEAWKKGDYTYGEKDKSIFKVNLSGLKVGDPTLANFVQNLSIHNDDYTSILDYAKLFYNYGLYSLKMLVGILIGIDETGKKSPISNTVKILYAKLAYIMNDREYQFNELLNEDEESKNNKLSFNLITNLIENLFINYTENKNSRIELELIMSALYSSLSFYLLGCIYNLIKSVDLSISSFYDSKTVTEAANSFIDKTLGKLELETENKFYSLLYTFYLMTKFYENNTGIDINDPKLMPLIAIAKIVAEMKEEYINEKLDITELTQGDLDNYKNNFRSYLDTPSLLKDTAMYFTSFLSHDNSSKCSVALGIMNIMDVNNEDVKINPIEAAISVDTPTSDYTLKNVEILYNYFNTIFLDSINSKLSPSLFHKIVLFASLFKKIKDYTSGEVRALASLGYYKADAYLVYLYKTWFRKGIVFRIDDTVKTYSNKIILNTLKAKTYINQDITLYTFKNEKTENVLELKNKHYGFITDINDINREENDRDIKSISDSIESFSISLPNLENIAYPASDISELDELVEKYNSGEISLFTLYFINKNSVYGLSTVNKILELDYNNKTLEELSEYAKNASEEELLDEDKILLTRIIKGNIKQILRDENEEKERFRIYFNSFLKGTAMIFIVANEYEKIISNDKESFIKTKEFEENESMDNILSMIPQIKSNKTFNFLNKSR